MVNDPTPSVYRVRYADLNESARERIREHVTIDVATQKPDITKKEIEEEVEKRLKVLIFTDDYPWH